MTRIVPFDDPDMRSRSQVFVGRTRSFNRRPPGSFPSLLSHLLSSLLSWGLFVVAELSRGGQEQVLAIAMNDFPKSRRHVDRRKLICPLVLTTLTLLSASGCATSLLNMSDSETFSERFSQLMSNDKKREKEEDNDFDTETKVETPLLGEYISVTGNNLVALRGVGLVVGLDGTGGDPPPSHLRKELMDEMARMKIPNPSRILASRNTALVMVTAYLPAMVREGQRFDVRVVLPPNSEATSLKGGRLLETRLAEERSVAGRGNLKGHEYGIASGAILTALGDGGRSESAMLRRGSIPGGAVSKTERDLEIILRNKYRSLKASRRIEKAISDRLHHYDRRGQRVPMAEAKTDMMIELKVHPTYRNNFPRYQQMIRSIAYKETDIARRLRMEELGNDILTPEKSAKAALQLEAIGRHGIPFLKAALESPNQECRFHAAQSLAYLEDSSGVEVLKQAALEEPAFRVYALAALSVINDGESVIGLRELIAEGDMETRYGAVRALKENNPRDPMLGTTEHPGRFILHAVEKSAEPAVHVVRYRAPEVVVFDRHQEIRLPAVLNVGNRIRVIGKAGENTVTVTKYSLDAPPERKVVSTNLVRILDTVAELGARYPDVVQMLLEADEQACLMGELGIDRLPQAGRSFTRKSDGDSEGSKRTRVGSPSLIPGLFDRVEESQQEDDADEESAFARMFAMRDAAAEGESDVDETTDLKTAAETPTEPESDMEDSDTGSLESIDADQIEALNLSEEAEDSDISESLETTENDDDDEFRIEASEFREPMGVKIRRILLSPFQNNE